MALGSKMKMAQKSFSVIFNTVCQLTIDCGANIAPDEQVSTHQFSLDDYLRNQTWPEGKHHRQNRVVPFLGEKLTTTNS